MTRGTDTPPFALATVSISGSPTFPVMIFDDNATIAVDAILPLAAKLGRMVTGADSLLGLLQNWDYNFEALCDVAAALADQRGRGFRSGFTDIAFFAPFAPVSLPRQIIGNAPNQREMAARDAEPDAQAGERGACSFFSKLPTSIIGPREPIHLPRDATDIVPRVELGVVFGRMARHVAHDQALDAVAGYMIVDTIASRDNGTSAGLQEREDAGLLSGSSPGFSPTGPYLVPRAFVANPHSLGMTLSVNGEVVQTANTASMRVDIAHQIAHITSRCQLLPGDILCTGSCADGQPARPCVLEDGDIVEASIEGLGQQVNNCLRETR